MPPGRPAAAGPPGLPPPAIRRMISLSRATAITLCFRLASVSGMAAAEGGRGAMRMSTATDARGFIGLGIMGDGMARNLLQGGYKLKVWNRSASKSEALRAEFPDLVEVAQSAADVTASCKVTFSMLSTPEAAASVFEGDDGVLAGIQPGHMVVDCATLEESDMKRMHAAVEEKGGKFLEAPVSGSKVPAATGALVFLAAGSEDAWRAVQDELGLMGKASHYLGEIGAGTRMKLAVNMCMGSMLAAMSESVHLAQQTGLNGDQLVEILGQGAMACPMFALKGPKVAAAQRDHDPHFPLKHAQKDMEFALRLAKEQGVQLSVASAANHLMKAAMDQGWSDSDFSAVAEAVMEKK